MALITNRTISDSASTASFEIVNNGQAPPEANEVIVDVSSLIGAAGDGTERVRVTHVTALVAKTVASPPSGICVTLSWDGSDDFLTLPEGTTSLKLACNPKDDATGDILISAPRSNLYTLFLTVEKIRGYPLSTAN